MTAVQAALGRVAAAKPGSTLAPEGEALDQARTGGATALLAFIGAVLGGLLLNIMPCVFPILSLKALSLAKANAGEGARAEAQVLPQRLQESRHA